MIYYPYNRLDFALAVSPFGIKDDTKQKSAPFSGRWFQEAYCWFRGSLVSLRTYGKRSRMMNIRSNFLYINNITYCIFFYFCPPRQNTGSSLKLIHKMIMVNHFYHDKPEHVNCIRSRKNKITNR